MRVVIAVAIIFLTSCAPWQAIEHGRIPESGCVMLPKGKLLHGDSAQWQANIMIRCSLGSGVESH